jgi:hypothetical protein
MARHIKDIISELMILQNKMDAIFEECLNDSMTRPLLWVQYKDTFDDTTLTKLKAGSLRLRSLIQRGYAQPRTRKTSDNQKALVQALKIIHEKLIFHNN